MQEACACSEHVHLYVCALFEQPALVAFDNVVKEKVVLVCVMELASQRAPHDKSIPFTEIAAATRMLPEQVCVVQMRGLFLCAFASVLPSVLPTPLCVTGGVGVDEGHVSRAHPREHRRGGPVLRRSPRS